MNKSFSNQMSFLISLFIILGMLSVGALAQETCNYVDDDGDGLCFGGSNDGNVCTVAANCPGGSCITIDEDFTYNGKPPGDSCDGQGECGIGFVQCNGSSAAQCSTEPGGFNDQSTTEICDYEDDDCDGYIDNGFFYNGIPMGDSCNGIGECGIGFAQCNGTASTQCSTEPEGFNDQSQPESCNGLDDDCDGEVDEDFVDTDTDGIADCVDICPNDYDPNQVDTDTDGYGDLCDNCLNDYNPSQADSDGDQTGNACDPDCPNLDALNPVSVVDLAILAEYWQDSGANLPGDLNGDGGVDMVDLGILITYWLSDCYEEQNTGQAAEPTALGSEYREG